MNILTLDCGTKTGWASLVDGKIESGVQNFALKRGESKGIRFLRFNTWLNDMLELVKPHIVVYEMAHFRGGSATEILVGMTTRIEQFCEEKKIEYSSIHSGTLKRFATGKGNASKEDMRRAAVLKYEIIVDNDDEADALHILAWAKKEFTK